MQELPNLPNLGERIRYARKVVANMTQVEMAEALAVSPQAVSGWERGEDDPTLRNREAIASLTGVPLEYLVIEGPRSISRFKQPAATNIVAPEIDVRAGAGPGGISVLEVKENEFGDFSEVDSVKATWGIPARYVREELRSKPDQIRLVEVLGDSMEPTLGAGDRVMIDTGHRSPSPPGVYAVWDGYGVVVKRVELVPLSDPPKVRLISDNKNHREYEVTLEEANIIGRIVARVSAM